MASPITSQTPRISAASGRTNPGTSPEMAVILECCRFAVYGDDVRPLLELLQQPIDWVVLMDMAMWHNVTPLLYLSLSTIALDSVPAASFAALRVHFEKNRQRMRLLTNELITISNTCQNNGIGIIPFKGPLLSHILTGDSSMRVCSDLDFLVQDAEFASSMQLIEPLGYVHHNPLTPAQFRAFRRYADQIQMVRRDGDVTVEMHWALAPRVMAIALDYAGIWQRAGRYRIDKYTLTNFAVEDLLIILCVHGSKETWSRLKWVHDVAGLLATQESLDLGEALRLATDQGCRWMLLIGLGLAHRLLRASVPDAVVEEINANVSVSELLDQSIQALNNSQPTPGSFWKLNRFRRLCHERRGDRARYVLRTLFTPNESTFRIVKLPDSLFWAYYPIRLVHDYLLLPCWLMLKRLRYREPDSVA